MATCTPRFKEDAQNSWVTQEDETKLNLWLHPQSQMTLEDAAKVIENYLAAVKSQAPNLAITADQFVESMTFRGQRIARPQMADHRAVDMMRENEPFSLLYRVVPTVSILGLICPCCKSNSRGENNSGAAPQAQNMHSERS